MKKFFAVCFLTSVAISAMDSARICHPYQNDESKLIPDELKKEKLQNHDQNLSNTEKEKPKYESTLFKLIQFMQDKGITGKVQNVVQLSKNQIQKIMQSRGVRVAIGSAQKVVDDLKKRNLYDKFVPFVAGLVAYKITDYLPFTCVDLPGLRPSCFLTTTPIGVGLCFPYACKVVKVVGLGLIAYITYLKAKIDSQVAKEKSE